MKTLKDLIQRLQDIKATGSMLALHNFIEELERLDAIQPVPVAPAAVEHALALAVDNAPAAGPNAPADPDVQPEPPPSSATVIVENIVANVPDWEKPTPDTPDTP